MTHTDVDVNFETILAQEPLIEELIKSKQVNLFSKYPEYPDYSDEFLDWISPKYLDVFNHIFEEAISKNREGKLLAFLKTPNYCNKATAERIVTVIHDYIEQRNQENTTFLENLKANTQLVNDIYGKQGFRIIRNIEVTIFNTLSHPKIDKIKVESFQLAYDVLIALKGHNQKEIGMILHNQNVEQIKRLDFDENTQSFKDKFSQFIIIKPGFEIDFNGKTLLSIVIFIIAIYRLIRIFT